MISMQSIGWRFQYSPGMPRNPTPDGSGWMFTFPSTDGVHYLSSHILQDISKHKDITMSCDILGTDPVFTAVEGGIPSVRLYFQRKGDGGTESYANYRWWSNPESIVLEAPASFSITVPLTPDRWTNVDGKKGTDVPNAFNAAKVRCANIGMTFGGTFFGHGVYATNSPSFHCRSYVLAES